MQDAVAADARRCPARSTACGTVTPPSRPRPRAVAISPAELLDLVFAADSVVTW